MTRTERTYYLISGGYNLAQFFLAPVYPLFLLSRGLDLFEMNVVLAVYLLTAFAFDVPTGLVADRFGRKVSFILACGVRTFAFLLYTRTQSLADCLVAEVIDGIGATLATGALDAWAVDGAHAEGDRRPADRMFARAFVIAQATMLVGGIVSGYLAQRNLDLPWYVAAAVFTSTGLVATLLMREARGTPAHHMAPRLSLRETTVAAVNAVTSSRPLMLLCGLTCASAFAVFPLYHYWQARLQQLTGEGPWLMGWVLAATNLAGLAGTALVPRLVGRFGRARVLAVASLWRGVALAICAGATRAPQVIVGMLLHGGGSISEPVLVAWTNEHVDAQARATVLSVRTAFLTLGGALGLLVSGVVARADGIPPAWAICAVVFAIAAPGYLALGRIAKVQAPDLGVELPAAPTKVSAPGG